VVLVYDVERVDSFENLQQWLREVELYSPNNGESVIKLLVGNKIDLDRVLPRERAEAWARERGMLFLEASAKTRAGIKQVFLEVVKKMLENPDTAANARPGAPMAGGGNRVQLRPSSSGRPSLDDDDDGGSGCC
jgi:Ras-related protein Rab-18